MPIPQAISDALAGLQTAKDASDAALAAQQQTASQLATAQAADTAAQASIASANAALNTSRQQLEAILDSYYSPGGTSPATPAATKT